MKGFKDFIMKGNVVDLAVAVVIGAAFAQVVNAVVDSVLMPLIAALFRAPSFDDWLVLDINGVLVKFGVVLTAVIGIPGLALYLTAVKLGVNLTVAPATLNDVWWRLPVLVLAAIENGFLEEVLVVGYLITRLEQLRLPAWAVVAISAVLRGSYHLYQGFGGFLGNAVMGVVFALWFRRTRRLWPLVVAHSLLDIVAFAGYALLAGHVSWLP